MVQIQAECPNCENVYHLLPNLIGKKMRCVVCGDLFEVREKPEPTPAPGTKVDEDSPVADFSPENAKESTEDSPNISSPERQATKRSDTYIPPYSSGAVGDLVPILDANLDVNMNSRDSVSVPEHLNPTDIYSQSFSKSTQKKDDSPYTSTSSANSEPLHPYSKDIYLDTPSSSTQDPVKSLPRKTESEFQLDGEGKANLSERLPRSGTVVPTFSQGTFSQGTEAEIDQSVPNSSGNMEKKAANVEVNSVAQMVPMLEAVPVDDDVDKGHKIVPIKAVTLIEVPHEEVPQNAVALRNIPMDAIPLDGESSPQGKVLDAIPLSKKQSIPTEGTQKSKVMDAVVLDRPKSVQIPLDVQKDDFDTIDPATITSIGSIDLKDNSRSPRNEGNRDRYWDEKDGTSSVPKVIQWQDHENDEMISPSTARYEEGSEDNSQKSQWQRKEYRDRVGEDRHDNRDYSSRGDFRKSDKAGRYDVEEEDTQSEALGNTEDEIDKLLSKRRKGKKRIFRRGLLLLVCFALITTTTVATIYIIKFKRANPARLFTKAKEEYEKGDYLQASKSLDQFLREYPEDERKAEVKFFLELSIFRNLLATNLTPDDLIADFDQWEKFQKLLSDPAIGFFSSKDQYGLDVWQALVKLGDDTVERCQKDFNQDKPLEIVKWFGRIDPVIVAIPNYHPDQVDPDKFITEIEKLKEKVELAKIRLGNLAIIDQILADPDDEQLRVALEFASKCQLVTDNGYIQRVQNAENAIRARVNYQRFPNPVPPIAIGSFMPKPQDLLRNPESLMFTHLARSKGTIPAGKLSGVFFAQARGILYALEESTGKVRWAFRVGLDSIQLPVRVPVTPQSPDTVLVYCQRGSIWYLVNLQVQNGNLLWVQKLPSAPLDKLVLVGNRAYVPLQENNLVNKEGKSLRGIIYEVEIISGFALGTIQIGRPLGSGIVNKTGTGILFIPTEAKGIYIFDVEKYAANGLRLDPQFIGMLNTDHGIGSLQGLPILVFPDPDPTAPGYLILPLIDSLHTMKLRGSAFAMVDGAPVLQGAPIDLNFKGWLDGVPYCDGERLLVITDQGELNFFGINQFNNQDPSIFKIQTDLPSPNRTDLLNRSEIVYAEEGSTWVLINGYLFVFKSGFDPEKGNILAAQGAPIPLGDTVQPVQISSDGSRLMTVSRPANSKFILASSIQSSNGEIDWQVQLGVDVIGETVQNENDTYFTDRSGGLHRLPREESKEPMETKKENTQPWASSTLWQIHEDSTIAAAIADLIAPVELLIHPETRIIYLISAIHNENGYRLKVRDFNPKMGAKGVNDRGVAIPANLAGNAIFAGNYIVFPLNNGRLYRISLGEMLRLEEGPTWRDQVVQNYHICHLSSLNGDHFFATNGDRELQEWQWGSEAGRFDKMAGVVLAHRIDHLIPVIGTKAPQLLTTENSGKISLWSITSLREPLQSWVSEEKDHLLTGKLQINPILFKLENDKIGFVYADRSGHIIKRGIQSSQDDLILDLLPKTRGNFWKCAKVFSGILLLVDREGHIEQIRLSDGKSIGLLNKQPLIPVEIRSILRVNEKTVTVALGDGSLKTFARIEEKEGEKNQPIKSNDSPVKKENKQGTPEEKKSSIPEEKSKLTDPPIPPKQIPEKKEKQENQKKL